MEARKIGVNDAVHPKGKCLYDTKRGELRKQEEPMNNSTD